MAQIVDVTPVDSLLAEIGNRLVLIKQEAEKTPLDGPKIQGLVEEAGKRVAQARDVLKNLAPI